MSDDTLSKKILTPSRPRLALAREVVEGHKTPRAAWEALASRGVIPMSWIGAERRFAGSDCAACRGTGWETTTDYRGDEFYGACERCEERGFRELLDAPPTLAACVAFASDPEGIETAEALAREADARLAPWRAPEDDAPARPLWRVYRARPPEETYFLWDTARPASHPAILLAHADKRFEGPRPLWAEEVGLRSAASLLRGFAEEELRCSRGWQEAARLGLVIPDGSPFGRGLSGRAFKELPDPFAPVASLWATGYALCKRAGGFLWLFAPPAPKR
jgi:hypothetical protein